MPAYDATAVSKKEGWFVDEVYAHVFLHLGSYATVRCCEGGPNIWSLKGGLQCRLSILRNVNVL